MSSFHHEKPFEPVRFRVDIDSAILSGFLANLHQSIATVRPGMEGT
jgi:hypothetical protein